VEYARTMRRYLPPIDRAAAEHRWSLSTQALSAAIDRLEREGEALNAARDSAVASATPAASLDRANRSLMRVERALTRPSGLRSRPWFRNLIYVADENNGYANMALPSINEAIRTGDEALTRSEIADLATRFDAATRALAEARAALHR
jgi:N-acetylated-alpha-linked acidic dipeptidase